MKPLAALIALALTAGVVLAPPAGPDLLAYGCAVGLRSTGPVIIDDANHHCSPSVTGVSLAGNGDLVVTYDAVDEVVACVAEEDETLVDRDVVAGPSVGLTSAIVKFAVAGTPVAADSATVTGTTSNIFLMCLALPEAA
jgi:hypothetical protein